MGVPCNYVPILQVPEGSSGLAKGIPEAKLLSCLSPNLLPDLSLGLVSPSLALILVPLASNEQVWTKAALMLSPCYAKVPWASLAWGLGWVQAWSLLEELPARWGRLNRQ